MNAVGHSVTPAPPTIDDGGKVVVHEDHVGSLLGHILACAGHAGRRKPSSRRGQVCPPPTQRRAACRAGPPRASRARVLSAPSKAAAETASTGERGRGAWRAPRERTRDAHGQACVGLLQGRRVIHAVASHCHVLACARGMQHTPGTHPGSATRPRRAWHAPEPAKRRCSAGCDAHAGASPCWQAMPHATLHPPRRWQFSTISSLCAGDTRAKTICSWLSAQSHLACRLGRAHSADSSAACCGLAPDLPACDRGSTAAGPASLGRCLPGTRLGHQPSLLPRVPTLPGSGLGSPVAPPGAPPGLACPSTHGCRRLQHGRTAGVAGPTITAVAAWWPPTFPVPVRRCIHSPVSTSRICPRRARTCPGL